MNDLVDISPDHLKVVQEILRENLPSGVAVWVFGSRASWATSDSSDLDLALEGDIDHDTILALEMAFEESSLPYTVDVVDLHHISDNFRRIVEAHKITFPMMEDSNNRDGWHMVPLMDIIDLRISSVDKKTKNNEQLVWLCNYTDVYNNSFIYADMDFMPATATEHEISKCLLSRGDVVITKDSEKYDDIGVPALIREDVPNLVCGYHLAILRPTPKIDGTYLYYVLSTRMAQHQFQSYANGITRFGLRKADIGLVEIPLPPLDEQRAIAGILRTLDDKIDLNRRMNQTLEEMSRALFKSWFVDFDPVRAKMDGRWKRGESLPGLPVYLFKLFPDRLADSELGPIPEGWEVRKLETIIELVYGKALKAADRNKGKIPVYGSNGQVGWHDKKLVNGPGIVVGRKGNPGIVNWVYGDFFPIDTTFYILPKIDYVQLPFLFFALSEQDLSSASADSAVPGLNRNLTYMNLQVIPARSVLQVFDIHITKNFVRRHQLEMESHILTAQRDALLPRLMSGELQFPQPAGVARA